MTNKLAHKPRIIVKTMQSIALISGSTILSLSIHAAEESDITPTALKNESSARCATLTNYKAILSDKEYFSAEIIKINNENILRRSRYNLPKGEYTLHVKEAIQSRLLSQNIPYKYRVKKLTVKLDCGDKKVIAAKFNRDAYRDRSNYWQPSVKPNNKI